QLKTTTLTMSLQNNFYTARLMHKSSDLFVENEIEFLDNETWVNIGNWDLDELDLDDDYVRIVHNVTSTSDGLEFDFSSAGTFTVDLGEQIGGNESLNIFELPLKPMDAE